MISKIKTLNHFFFQEFYGKWKKKRLKLEVNQALIVLLNRMKLLVWQKAKLNYHIEKKNKCVDSSLHIKHIESPYDLYLSSCAINWDCERIPNRQKNFTFSMCGLYRMRNVIP